MPYLQQYLVLGLVGLVGLGLPLLLWLGLVRLRLVLWLMSWIGDKLRLLGAIEIHCSHAVYVSLNTNANPNPDPKLSPSPNPNPKWA